MLVSPLGIVQGCDEEGLRPFAGAAVGGHGRVSFECRKGQAGIVDKKLVAAFDDAMLEIYQRALSEANYHATRFLRMLHEHRGLETARLLLHSANVSEGYSALWERGRLDLTVEALVHDNPRWHALFTEEELAICKKRLEEYGYVSTTGSRSRTP